MKNLIETLNASPCIMSLINSKNEQHIENLFRDRTPGLFFFNMLIRLKFSCKNQRECAALRILTPGKVFYIYLLFTADYCSLGNFLFAVEVHCL